MKKTLILTAILIMTASTVLAADTTTTAKTDTDRKCPPCKGQMMPPPPHEKGYFEKRLNLTDAQKEKLKKNREASRAKIDPLFQQIRQKEQAKREIFKKYEQTDADLIKLNNEIKDLKAKCDVIRESNKKYFESILTKEQKAELEKMKQEHVKYGKRPPMHENK